MVPALKPREYYEDLYDKFTVEHCRNHMARFDVKQGLTEADFENPNITAEELKELKTKVIKGQWLDLVREMTVFMYAGERYNKKNSEIEEWMREDRAKDDFYTSTEPPQNTRCRKCLSTDLRLVSKDLYWEDSKYDRVLFMFQCRECGTRSAYFNNGEEWKVRATICPICQSERNTFTKSEKDNIITISYACQRCDNTWQETLDLSPTEPEKPDPYYHDDRKLYCYSKTVREYAESMLKSGPILKHFASDEELEKQAQLKQRIDSIQKLTIAQVSATLTKLLKKRGYTDLRLGEPSDDRQLVVPFTLIDDKPDRTADQSRSTVWRLVSKELEPTNWRLMRSNLNYRLGYVRGKLKGYEGEFELQKLLEKSGPKPAKKSE